jgi:hypothetical protein
MTMHTVPAVALTLAVVFAPALVAYAGAAIEARMARAHRAARLARLKPRPRRRPL